MTSVNSKGKGDGGKTFTQKEMMDIVDRMNKDYTAKFNQMSKALQETQSILVRLNYLFKVVEQHSYFEANAPKFLQGCLDEIVDIMTVKEDKDGKA